MRIKGHGFFGAYIINKVVGRWAFSCVMKWVLSFPLINPKNVYTAERCAEQEEQSLKEVVEWLMEERALES